MIILTLLNFMLQSDTSQLLPALYSEVLERLKIMAPEAEDGSQCLPHGSGLFANQLVKRLDGTMKY